MALGEHDTAGIAGKQRTLGLTHDTAESNPAKSSLRAALAVSYPFLSVFSSASLASAGLPTI